MERSEKLEGPRFEDPLPDQIPTQKLKRDGVSPGPAREQIQERRADNLRIDQVATTSVEPSDTSPEPSKSQNCKKRAGQSLPHEQTTSLKKLKSTGAARGLSTFPPEFYDNLSQLWLTSRALKEFDRRNEIFSLLPTRTVNHLCTEDLAQAVRKGGPDLARFARTGGPDLSNLQGWPQPGTISTTASTTSSATSEHIPGGSEQTTSIKAITMPMKCKRSSAYDANFEQHLIDNNIYPPHYDFPDDRKPPKPANWGEIREALKAPRGLLSPSLVPSLDFEDFQRKNMTKSEGSIMRNVVPLLAGNASIPNEGHIPFTNLKSLTSDTTVNPAPDFFDGAYAGDLDKKIRKELAKIIMPSKKAGIPIAPNLFLEAKGSGGTFGVANGQAVLNGAHGATIMHALQNYRRAKPLHDDNAYAFTATLLGGILTLYAHHITAPIHQGQRPEYHTTVLKAYALVGDDEVWIEGIGAFRNLRMLAKTYRDRFIETANARARKQYAEAADAEENDDLANPTQAQQDEGSSPLDLTDCPIFAEPDDDGDDDETHETPEAHKLHAGLTNANYGGRDFEIAPDYAPNLASSSTSARHQDVSQSRRPPKLPRTPPSPSSTRPNKR